MAGELVRPTPIGAPVPFGFGKQMRQVNAHGALALRADRLRADLVGQRVDNAVYLAGRAAIGITNLNGLVTALAKDNPGLELELRHIEEGVAIGVRHTIYDYLTGR